VPGHVPAYPPPAKRSPWPYVLAFAVLGIAVGVVLQLGLGEPKPQPQLDTARSTAAGAAASHTASATPSASTSSSAPTPAPAGSNDDSDELPPGIEVPTDYGLVAVVAPSGAHVRIDGAIAGSGPQVQLAAAPGTHEVRIEQEGQDATKQVIEVRSGKTTRVRSAQAP
jgi:hypothetical protein